MKRVAIVANLVLGADFSYSPSRELTTAHDRERFHEIREGAGLIVIGGNTARQEPYEKSLLPTLVITRQENSTFSTGLLENENVQIRTVQDGTSLAEIVIEESEKLYRKSGMEKFLLIEAGPHFIAAITQAELLDTLFLTRTHKIASGARLDEKWLLQLNAGATLVDQYFVHDEADPVEKESCFEEWRYWRGESL
jgi:riboflavin biosynthesis pyrimidine reductase